MRDRSSPRVLFIRRFAALVLTTFVALLSFGSTGCTAMLDQLGQERDGFADGLRAALGEYEAESTFLVKATPDERVSDWSEIKVPVDPWRADSAVIMHVEIEAQDTNLFDLTFLQDITASVDKSSVSTPIAQKTFMPDGEPIVVLDRVYDGDIRQFVHEKEKGDGYTLQIDWSGRLNPTKSIPWGGIVVDARVTIRLD